MLRPQITTRPIGLVTSLRTYHMFQRRETFLKLAQLPFERMLAEMHKPEVKAAILSDADIPPTQTGAMANVFGLMAMAAPNMFPIDLPINYEPQSDSNIGALAMAANQDVAEFMYDFFDFQSRQPICHPPRRKFRRWQFQCYGGDDSTPGYNHWFV